MRKYQHIIWDWNGTLLDDAWLCVEVLNEMLTRRAMAPVTPGEYEAEFCFPVRDYYGKIGFDFAADPYENVATEFMNAYDARRGECALRAGAREALEAIHARGVPQSILSAYQQWRLEEAVEARGLRGLFTHLAGLDDHYADDKIEIGRRLIARLGVHAGAALMVGDTTHDAQVARAIGAGCVLIPSGHHPPGKLEATGARVLASLAEVPALLDG